MLTPTLTLTLTLTPDPNPNPSPHPNGLVDQVGALQKSIEDERVIEAELKERLRVEMERHQQEKADAAAEILDLTQRVDSLQRTELEAKQAVETKA